RRKIVLTFILNLDSERLLAFRCQRFRLVDDSMLWKFQTLLRSANPISQPLLEACVFNRRKLGTNQRVFLGSLAGSCQEKTGQGQGKKHSRNHGRTFWGGTARSLPKFWIPTTM